MRRLVAFVRLSRLKFLVGGFAGGALGTAIAFFETHGIVPAAYVLAQLTITSAHLMSHYANEYFDLASDALTTRTSYSGGSGVLVDGTLDPKVALVAALVCSIASIAGDALLLVTGHALAAALGIGFLALAWSYSAPPMRFVARGLGELDTALVVAILVPLCAYAAQTNGLDVRAVASTVPGAAAMFVMMVCVQIPDLAADAATGKCNLVVRLGASHVVRLAFTAIVAEAAGVALALALGAPAAYAAFQLVALVPLALLVTPLYAFGAGRRIVPAGLAARGVALFATVAIAGALGYAYAAIV
jgi:1,4-dihydroxy-2-naphthoate octaprenyltransferase